MQVVSIDFLSKTTPSTNYDEKRYFVKLARYYSGVPLSKDATEILKTQALNLIHALGEAGQDEQVIFVGTEPTNNSSSILYCFEVRIGTDYS